MDHKPQAIGRAVDLARGGQLRSPGSRTTSTRRTIPKTHALASKLASLLDGSSPGDRIPERSRYGLQQPIELEVAAFLGADCHERSKSPVSRICREIDERVQAFQSRPLQVTGDACVDLDAADLNGRQGTAKALVAEGR
ncbi:MAG: transposase [Cyanobium sp.]|nr:transposase [Synechococcaceae cyanobacterium]